jgi:crotonobetainyl-CoA:carnitine CoA-transferase CaiB-like acyl-CoA transferase
VCEAFGGLRHITGFPNQPPVRSNISIGDSLAGLHAAFGTVMALLVRDKLKHAGSGGGQVVDVAIYESVFNMLESIVPEYDRFNMIREPSGTTITGVVPSGTWQCKDGTYIVVGGNGDSVYQRLMEAIGRPDMVGGAFATNADRMNNLEAIDEALAAWTRQHDAQDAIEHLEKARVPVGKIYTVKDMFHDEHYKSRKLLETVDVHGSPLTIPAILPKLSRTKGSTEWAGPDLGVHTRQVLQELLGMQEEELAVLEQEGVIQT